MFHVFNDAFKIRCQKVMHVKQNTFLARTKMKYENKPRAITPKIRSAEQQFLCTSLRI
jgi:hypothetical protein